MESTGERAEPASSLESAGDGRAAVWQRGVPVAATGLGLLIAFAGILAAPEDISVGAATQRVSVALPQWFGAAALASLLLAGAIFTAIVMPRPRRRRKKGDDDLEIYHEPRRVPPLLGAALILLALAPGVVLVAMLFWFGQENALAPQPGATVPSFIPFVQPPVAATSPPQFAHKPASPVTTALLVAVAGLVGFGALAFVAWLALADRWLRRLPLDDLYRAEVAQAVDASLEDLTLEKDARTAILKIYRNLERVLAGMAIPRRPWQTPTEFIRAALGKLPLSPQLAAELTRLFEVARFSNHPVGADERNRAWQSLLTIRMQLNRPGSPSDGRIP